MLLSIRPEQMQLATAGSLGKINRLTGKVLETTFLGEASEHVLDIGGHKLKAIAAPPVFDPPSEVSLEFDPDDVVVLPRQS